MSLTSPSSSDVTRPGRWKPISVIIGGVLVHLTLGTLYTFGNLNPYLTSYLRRTASSPTLTYTQCSWVYALACMGQGAAMFGGGLAERKLGPRLTTLMGCWFMSLGVFLTRWSVQHSFLLTVLTYGLMFGLGMGFAYAVPISCAIKWFPHRKGLVSGCIVAGFGGGAFIFDQVQTAYINPDNLTPTHHVGSEQYFLEDAVLDRVPNVFLVMGASYSFMQFIGSMLLCYPPGTMEQELEMSDNSRKSPNKSLANGSNVYLLHRKPRTMAIPDDLDIDRPPCQMLQSRAFYKIFFMFLFTGQGMIFVSTLYKAYGQTFIADDSFLSLVGTFAALFNGCGRIFWGSLADAFSFRLACVCLNSAFTCLMLTLQLVPLAGKVLFLLYVCLLFGSFSGIYALFPTATAKCFGRKHIAVNYGIVFTNQIITAPLGVFASHTLMSSIGWHGLFYLVAACTFCSLLMSLSFNVKDRDGKEI